MNGSDPASTFGGPGWLPRTTDHAAEVAAGSTWRRCGYRSEWGRLESALLARPPDALAATGDPSAALMFGVVDLGRMRGQADALRAVLEAEDVDVVVDDRPAEHPANYVFQRDLYTLTPEGAVLSRMASAQRAGEERWAARALAEAGVPILSTVRGSATMEGADVLWVAPDRVVVGVGFRTNDAGADAVAAVLEPQGVRVQRVPLGAGVQHLLGGLQIVGERWALVRRSATTPPLRGVLDGLGYRLVVVEDSVCERNGGLGIVVLGPGRVLVSSSAVELRHLLDRHGIESVPVDVGDYLLAGGGPQCVVGVLRRGDGPAVRAGQMS